ncbi:MAG: hypothetical protein BGO38_15045 [Cellulomonas sp. 73-145]|nr:MAG: hypothetical protein BGO38_15045 [Cellulomonas sp. 73-145]
MPEGCQRADADPEAVIDVVSRLPAGTDALLVTNDPQARKVAQSVRLALGGERVGLVHHEAPPTAFYLALSAAQLLPEQSLGLAGELLTAVSAATSTSAVLSSVASLQKPSPSLLHHVASLWPPSRFAVDWQNQTVRLGDEAQAPEGVAVVVCASAKPVGPSQTRPGPATELEPEAGAAFWGAARWFEASVLLTGLDTLVARTVMATSAPGARTCPSCDRPGGADLCAFCQLPVVEPTGDTTYGGPA